MIAKKNKKANLERKRFAFFQIGLLVSGSLCLAAFEYSTAVPEDEIVFLETESFSGIEQVYEDQDVEMPKPEKQQPKVVNYENVDSLIKVDELLNQANTYVSNSNSAINMGDMGDPYGDDFDWGLAEPSAGDLVLAPDVEPSFVGGEAEMFRWISNEISYPAFCADMGIDGLVYIQFEVSPSGAISRVKSLQSPHDDLTAEAMRVVKKR
jgi:protein TonB